MTFFSSIIMVLCLISLVQLMNIPSDSLQNNLLRIRRSSSKAAAPKKFTTNPNPFQNMDKAIGIKKKVNGTAPKKYPWDSTQNKNVELSSTDFMKSFIKDNEEGFADDYYENYDFEFPKGQMRNDNFEVKKNRDMARRLEDKV